MRWRLLYAWLTLSVLWIGYSLYHATFYWTRWGSLIPDDRRQEVLLMTAYEILVAPVVLGLTLALLYGMAWALGRALLRQSWARRS